MHHQLAILLVAICSSLLLATADSNDNSEYTINFLCANYPIIILSSMCVT